MARRCRFADVKEIFSILSKRMMEEGLTKLLYRPAPHPYQRAPREDDLYSRLASGAEDCRDQNARHVALEVWMRPIRNGDRRPGVQPPHDCG